MIQEEGAVADDMYDFLQQFFKNHPQYGALPFFTIGESYAGHYVPAVTHKVWQMNQQLPAGALPINLKGTGVGNGLTNPEVQYAYYPEMAISTNNHAPAVRNVTYGLMKAAVGPCVEAIKVIALPSSPASACAHSPCASPRLPPRVAFGAFPSARFLRCVSFGAFTSARLPAHLSVHTSPSAHVSLRNVLSAFRLRRSSVCRLLVVVCLTCPLVDGGPSTSVPHAGVRGDGGGLCRGDGRVQRGPVTTVPGDGAQPV